MDELNQQPHLTKKRKLNKQLALLICSFMLLIAAAIFFTFAWFTRLANVGGLEFEVAQWDFRANEMVDDFYVNVFDYTTVDTDHAAPGTAGYIPITINASDSETDIDFYITIDQSTQSTEFQQRFSFYYLDEDDKKVYFTKIVVEDDETDLELEEGDGGDDGGDDGVGDGSDSDLNQDDDASTVEIIDTVYTGTVIRGSSETVYVYWEWAYELTLALEDDQTEYTEAQQTLIDEYNAFDTLVGKNPEAFEDEMMVCITVVGYETDPVLAVDGDSTS